MELFLNFLAYCIIVTYTTEILSLIILQILYDTILNRHHKSIRNLNIY
jgi:hypothetical protein